MQPYGPPCRSTISMKIWFVPLSTSRTGLQVQPRWMTACKTSSEQQLEPLSPTQTFFLEMSTLVKKLTKFHQNISLDYNWDFTQDSLEKILINLVNILAEFHQTITTVSLKYHHNFREISNYNQIYHWNFYVWNISKISLIFLWYNGEISEELWLKLSLKFLWNISEILLIFCDITVKFQGNHD